MAAMIALSGCAAITGATDLSVVPAEDDAGGSSGSSGTNAPSVGPSNPTDAGVDARLDAAESGPPIEAGPDANGPSVKRVFASSATYDGNLGGLAGADARCNQLAHAAGLKGTFVAWMSTSASFARDRVTGEGPWSLVGQADAAVVEAELTDPPITMPIGRDERGNTVTGRVWTGTNGAGRYYYGDCKDWTSAASAVRGTTGETSVTNAAWTAASPSDCNALHRLYCFEL